MHYTEQNDETLVLLTLAGEQDAYEVLVRRYEKSVISSAMSVTRSRYMAEDAAQDAFVTAWMKLNLLREPSKYGSWICRIAKNCAVSMIRRYSPYMSIDEFENCYQSSENTLLDIVESESRDELHSTVDSLPDKIRTVIRLHYFEGLSIAEIADRMRISEGTVKSQLHDGRKKLRKELCSMNEEMNDTLVRRVMKKVEELKNWQYLQNKSGFDKAYRDVLRDVEELPESKDRSHAMADVLVRGWWWLPGEKSEELFSRIVKAAEDGHNEEVMCFIIDRSISKIYGTDAEAYLLEKEIPRLEKNGFVKALGYAWFRLGYKRLERDNYDGAIEAYEKAKKIIPTGDAYFYCADALIKTVKDRRAFPAELNEKSFRLFGGTVELKLGKNGIRHWNTDYYGSGWLFYITYEYIVNAAARCDGQFTADIPVGESITGSDGTVLTHEAEGVTVDTPAGKFENCSVWSNNINFDTCKAFYKDGVGIVKQERSAWGYKSALVLSSYSVKGNGILPLDKGNTWEYSLENCPEKLDYSYKLTTAYNDGEKAVIEWNLNMVRRGYDENSWLDMALMVRNEYFDGSKCCDVTPAIKRMEELASTPLEKLHTKAAASVARRILETDPTLNPNYTESGRWNFLNIHMLKRDGKHIKLCDDNRHLFGFELKYISDAYDEALLYNNPLGLLAENFDYAWNDDWKAGFSDKVSTFIWSSYGITTNVKCEDAGEITTNAGTFSCIKLTIDSSGLEGGLTYIAGHKEYWLAEGIGIVRTLNEYSEGALTAVYELDSYEGVGEGYAPYILKNGETMTRVYKAVNLYDGCRGEARYYFMGTDDGTVLFSDLLGTKKKPEKIMSYSSIYPEVVEEDLWHENKHDESRQQNSINNFGLLAYFLTRNSQNNGAPERSVANNKLKIRIIEALTEDGTVPRAFLGCYARLHLSMAAALFGCGKNEEGYETLDKALTLFEEWAKVPRDEMLETGDAYNFGGITLKKGKEVYYTPDGKAHPFEECYSFDQKDSVPYGGMTAASGWEWFNGVREEERFKKAIERAKKLIK